MSRRRRTLPGASAVAAAVLSLTFPAPAVQAQLVKTQPVDRSHPEVVQNWIERLGETHQLLLEGKHRKARRMADTVLDEIGDRVHSGPIDTLLGTAIALRAVAEAGRGNLAEALWDWHTAKAIVPSLAESDLAIYGKAGTSLAEGIDAEPKSSMIFPDGDTSPPEKLKAPDIFYPRGLHAACVEGLVVVGVTIGEDGRPTRPWLIGTEENALMAFVALETVRKWRFRPARKNGRAVATGYRVRINFDIPGCRNPFAIAQQRDESMASDSLVELPRPVSSGLPASIEIRRVDPSPSEILTRPRMLRIRVDYSVPADLFASQPILLLPQFERRDAEGTFVVQQPHARVELPEPQGSMTLFYSLEEVWDSNLLADPIRLWVCAVAAPSEEPMEVIGATGPVTYRRQP